MNNLPIKLFLLAKAALFYDYIDYNTISTFWTFYPLSVCFFGVGIAFLIGKTIGFCVERRHAIISYVAFWLIACGGVCSLLGDGVDITICPNTNKINGMLNAVMFCIVYGMIVCFRGMLGIKWKKVIAGIVAGYYLLAFIFFIRFYYNDFHPKYFSDPLCNDAIEYVNDNDILEGRPIIVWCDEMYYKLSCAMIYGPGANTGNLINVNKEQEDIDKYVTEIYGAWAGYIVENEYLDAHGEMFDGYTPIRFSKYSLLFND